MPSNLKHKKALSSRHWNGEAANFAVGHAHRKCRWLFGKAAVVVIATILRTARHPVQCCIQKEWFACHHFYIVLVRTKLSTAIV